jgi:multiple sugar transport system permease protein
MTSTAKRKMREKTGRILFALAIITLVILVLIPLLWALSMSFKRPEDVFQKPIRYIPDPATLSNYIVSWNQNHFSRYFMNSLFVSIVAVVIVTVLAVLNGYALSRYDFKGRKAFLLSLVGTQLMPVIIFLIPLFLIFNRIGLINTRGSLIIFYTVSQIPFNSLLMKSFIDKVPRDIDEAAMIDGAGRMRIIATIIPPVILPGIVATASFAFIGCWNEFQAAFSFLTSAAKFTIAIGLKYLISESSINLSVLGAGSIIALIPPLLLFMYVQKYLVQGLSDGSVKG